MTRITEGEFNREIETMVQKAISEGGRYEILALQRTTDFRYSFHKNTVNDKVIRHREYTEQTGKMVHFLDRYDTYDRAFKKTAAALRKKAREGYAIHFYDFNNGRDAEPVRSIAKVDQGLPGTIEWTLEWAILDNTKYRVVAFWDNGNFAAKSEAFDSFQEAEAHVTNFAEQMIDAEIPEDADGFTTEIMTDSKIAEVE